MFYNSEYTELFGKTISVKTSTFVEITKSGYTDFRLVVFTQLFKVNFFENNVILIFKCLNVDDLPLSIKNI